MTLCSYWRKMRKIGMKLKMKKLYFTEERFLPRILDELGIYPSVSEIRKNKPELMMDLNEVDFIDGKDGKGLKIRKKHFMWIIVGK